MSSTSIKEEKIKDLIINTLSENLIEPSLSEIVIPFSSLIECKSSPDIYKGYEKIPFQQRHPVYKAIMKIEFEEALRKFGSNKKEK